MSPCDELIEHWQRRLDGDGSSDLGTLAAHIQQCPSCRELNGAMRILEEAKHAWLQPAFPPGLSDRLVQCVLADRRRRLRRRTVFAATALAASVLVALLSWNYVTHRPADLSSSPPDQTVAALDQTRHSTPSAPHSRVAGSHVSVNQSIHSAETALVSLAGRTADEAAEDGRVLLPTLVPVSALGQLPGWPDSLNQPSRSLRATREGMSVGLEPLASSARRAISLFLPEPNAERKQ